MMKKLLYLVTTFSMLCGMDKDQKTIETQRNWHDCFNRAIQNAVVMRRIHPVKQVSPPERKNIQINLCDQSNADLLKKYIESHGWPTISQGSLICSNACLIAIHADHDVKFQKQCLFLMEQAISQKQFYAGYFAYLIDRILVNEGKPQLYGTYIVKTELPFFDEKELDAINKRRENIGLCSVQETVHTLFKQELANSNQLSNFFNNRIPINTSPCE